MYSKEFIIIFTLTTRILLDSQTKETITGAKVTNGKEIVYTDFDGKFPISDLKDTLKIELISYKDSILINY